MVLSTHRVATDQNNTIGCLPRAGARILQAPDFRERRTGSKHGIIRDGQIFDELDAIATTIRSGCR